ncbi:MAG: hypothetical protein QXZ01_02915, partial [Candidatus Micrarchaeaceae archaeon]
VFAGIVVEVEEVVVDVVEVIDDVDVVDTVDVDEFVGSALLLNAAKPEDARCIYGIMPNIIMAKKSIDAGNTRKSSPFIKPLN